MNRKVKAFSFKKLSVLAFFVLLTACGDDGVSPSPAVFTEVGAVVNSTDNALSIFSVDDSHDVTTVGLGPDGSPVSLSVRGDRALVPMGTVPAAVVVNLRERLHDGTVALLEGSGASGSAFVDDNIALVANPNRNSVSVVNVSTLSLGEEIETGVFPQEVLVYDGRAFILNAELGEDFQPARTGTITVLDVSDFSLVETVELSGDNPAAGAFGSDGRLYVVLSGSFGAENGSLSVVDPEGLTEISHHEGFGDFPGSVAVGPDGRVHVSAWSYGIVVWDPVEEVFVRSPDEAIVPWDTPSTTGMAFDSNGRFYALDPVDCQESGTANRLSSGTFTTQETITVGTCPFGIAFSEVREETD